MRAPVALLLSCALSGCTLFDDFEAVDQAEGSRDVGPRDAQSDARADGAGDLGAVDAASDADAEVESGAPDSGLVRPDDIVGLAGGDDHTCALERAGTVFCWGLNEDGQLGNSSRVDSPRPARVLDLSDAVQIAAGRDTSCAVRSSGEVACWGAGPKGQLGVGEFGDTSLTRPLAVVGLTQVVEVGVGRETSCALTSAGEVWCWGRNQEGQIEAGSGQEVYQTAHRIEGVRHATDLAVGARHACAITRASGTSMDTEVRCWGDNRSGQVDATRSDRSLAPSTIELPGTASRIEAGGEFSCAILQSGDAPGTSISCWGAGQSGQTGAAQGTVRTQLTTVPLSEPPVGLSLGYSSGCALGDAGGIWCWGSNTRGQLGAGINVAGSSEPLAIPVLRGSIALGAGFEHRCAVRGEREVYCWGFNRSGQLGLEDTNDRSAPAKIQGF